MGEIIDAKSSGDKIRYWVKLSENEALQLRSHRTNVHLFPFGINSYPTRVIERGNKKGAKYFVIPLSLKSRKKKNYNCISYQKIDLEEKTFYISVVEKRPSILNKLNCIAINHEIKMVE